MACSLDTCTPPNPSNHRISFSNDFVEAHHQMGRPISQAQTPPPPSSDFEFLVSDYTMISAEELFFRGQLVPQKPNNTIREEMLLGDEDDNMFSFGPKKSSIKWKELLGFKKAQSGPKMVNKDERLLEKGPGLVLEHKAQVKDSISNVFPEKLAGAGLILIYSFYLLCLGVIFWGVYSTPVHLLRDRITSSGLGDSSIKVL